MTLIVGAVCVGCFLFLSVKGMQYIEGYDVPPWRKFKITCPVCQEVLVSWKIRAERRVGAGFGVLNMADPPTCERCLCDLSEPYMRSPYVANLIAEAKRAEQFKAVAAEYNAAVKTARKGASA